MPPKLKTVWICLVCGRRYDGYVKKCGSCQGTVKKKTIVEEGR